MKIKFSSNQIITDFIDYTGQKRKNVDNLKSYPTKTYKNIYFFLISSMIVPKNKQFVIQSVDNFYKLFVMYILNFLGYIYYFWDRKKNYFYRSILTQVTQKVVFLPLLHNLNFMITIHTTGKVIDIPVSNLH